jgi:hypothetical protein
MWVKTTLEQTGIRGFTLVPLLGDVKTLSIINHQPSTINHQLSSIIIVIVFVIIIAISISISIITVVVVVAAAVVVLVLVVVVLVLILVLVLVLLLLLIIIISSVRPSIHPSTLHHPPSLTPPMRRLQYGIWIPTAA